MKAISGLVWDDCVLPFQLDASDIRGRVARLDASLNAILDQHDYPEPVEALIAEAVLITALIGQTVKLRWKLSLQIRGNGPVRLVATDYFAPKDPGDRARIRAYASFRDGEVAPTPGFGQFGKGYFAILIDQGAGTTPWSGLTPLAGSSLADCAQEYFAQSEQIPTRFALSFGRMSEPGGAGKWRAGGIMIQHMPKASPFAAVTADPDPIAAEAAIVHQGEANHENWSRVNARLESVRVDDLAGPSLAPPDLLLSLFQEERPRVFDAQNMQFGCTCSSDRVRQTLSIYSDRDIAHMTTDEGIVTADCQFCGAHYELDPAGLGFEAGERGRERS